MTLENKIQFAKRINRAPSYITELISHGRIVLNGRRVDVEASLALLAQTASGANPAVAERHEAARKGGAPEKKDSMSMESGSRAKFKSMVMHYENQQIKIEMMLRRGLRFELADTRREAQAIGNTMRASVERLIDQSAPRLSVMQSRADRARLIMQEINKLNRIIKNEFPRALRRLTKANT